MAGRGNRTVETRVDDERRERWQVAAERAGYNLSEFVRKSVDLVVEFRLLEGKKTTEPDPKPSKSKGGS